MAGVLIATEGLFSWVLPLYLLSADVGGTILDWLDL